MVEIDWEKFMSIKPQTLSEQEKNDLCNNVVDYIPDFNLERKYLFHFLRVIQEVLKFKIEQVESLSSELDNVAFRQGEEVGGKVSQYIEEIEQLRVELDYYKKIEKSSSKSTYSSNEDLKREVVKLELQNDELLGELNEKEKDLLNEKKEVEKYAAQVAVLEKEKQELSKELKALQEETIEKHSITALDSSEVETEKLEQLTEIIRQKNKHISQLLEDLEVIEDENLTLQTKLTDLRDEVSETTTQMTEVTAQLTKLKHLNEEYERRNIESNEKIVGLTCQIEELVEEKNKHDKQLDEYITMFNAKLQEYNELVIAKDEHIVKLKEEIKNLYSSSAVESNTDSGEKKLNLIIQDQQKEIKILQEELEKATEEINNSTDLIEELKEKQIQLLSIPEHHMSVLTYYEEKIKVLEEKLQYAEEDAIVKAEEMSDLVIQLRDYESGVFGLSEAVNKIKKLEKQLQEKDLQLEKLIELCNNLEIRSDAVEEQNLTLREKLGLSASEEIDTSGVILRYKKSEEMLQNFKLQLDKKEAELVKIKLKYRKVINFLKMHPTFKEGFEIEHFQKSPDNTVEQELNKKLQKIIKENDALRKGMHEILESIRQQNCSGTVEVQSTCLQRLLEALDSRHVSGWYHPAMRLHAQLSTEEGKNEELRNQIRSLKTEEKKRASELQNAYLKIQSLEHDLSTPKFEDDKNLETNISKEEEGKKKEKEVEIEMEVEEEKEEVEKDEEGEKGEGKEEQEDDKVENSFSNTRIKFEQEKKIIQLESELQEFKHLHLKKRFEMENLERSFNDEKESLLSKITELEYQLKEFRAKSSDSDFNKLADVSQLAVLERKVVFLRNLETDHQEKIEKLQEETIKNEENMLRDIVKLQKEKSQLLSQIISLEEETLNTVSKEKFNALKTEYTNATINYQHVISLSVIKEDDKNFENLQAEVELLKSEKLEVFAELQTVKEKLIAIEALTSEEAVTNGDLSNEISILAGKLAASEVRESHEKQKSSHLEKLNEMMKSHQQEIETRNEELTVQVTKLSEDIANYQKNERKLALKVSSHDSEERLALMDKIKILEKRCDELTVEKDNIQELFEISQGQCRAFQEWQNESKITVAGLNEQILELQSSSDEKASISRISHELTMSKLLASKLTKQNNDLTIQVTKLLTQKVGLEMKINENFKNFYNEKKKYIDLIEYLYEALDEVRKIYSGSVRFRDVESIFKAKTELKNQKNNLFQKMKMLEKETQEYILKKEEMETQLESLEDLKSAFKGNPDSLIRRHNKNAELRLQQAKGRRKNEFLMAEIKQLEDSLKKLNEEITALEEESLAKEKDWEEKQILWEKEQQQMFKLLREKGVKKSIVKVSDVSTNTPHLIEDSRFKVYELKMQELEANVFKLTKENKEKDEMIAMKEEQLNDKKIDEEDKNSTMFVMKNVAEEEKVEDAEKEALKVTVKSLQDVIKQKEETILRYQDLLKEGREEYSRASSKLQEEIKGLNEAMAAQTKAYNKMKNSIQTNNCERSIVPEVEKYITKIDELEEELRECQMNLTAAKTQSYTNEQEVEKWKSLAVERLITKDDMKQKVEEEYIKEFENYNLEIAAYKKEIERLNQYIESLREEAAKDINRGHFREADQSKFLDTESNNIHVKSDQLSDCTFDKPKHHKSSQLVQEIETLKRQLKFSRDETLRLREQIRLLQIRSQKRSKTAGSSTSRSDSKSSEKEENLTNKIKNLEELLTVSKEREKELLEINEKKIKSAEEVARWNERKKSQQTIQNLTAKLKEKETEVEVLKNKNDSFRSMIYKCERDKNILESQLKAAKANGRVDKLISEKNQLELEIESLKNALDEQIRHSGGLGAALLQNKLEEQERKLAAFELTSKGQNAMIEEIAKLKSTISNLEKLNIQLESENLCLQLKFEKEKAETKYLLGKVNHCQENPDEAKSEDTSRTIPRLYKIIEKLTEANKRLQNDQKGFRTGGGLDKVRQDLMKLRESHKILKAKYMEAMDRNVSLEKEVKSCHYQIHLMKEKDLAEALTRSDNIHLNSDLAQELMEVKEKLSHKTHLLNRVKTLLVKAAEKEKVLHKEVCFLQSMVPTSVHMQG